MDRFRLPTLAAASLVLLAAAARAQTDNDRLTDVVQVQKAFFDGKEHLRLKQPRQAVEVLEAQLSRIDGNRAYLTVLRDAYRAYVTELFLSNQDELARKYLNRLRILDPAAAAAMTARPTTVAAPTVPAPAPVIEKTTAVSSSPPPSASLAALAVASAPTAQPAVKATVTARGKVDEEAPNQKQARDLLAQAESEFGQKHYGPARQLFEEASKLDPSATAGSRDRWAYCKLSRVVEELNRSPGADALPELEREVQAALALAPQMSEFGRGLLQQIGQRRQVPAAAPNVPVQHSAAGGSGWSVAETSHFRIFHTQSREFAEQAAAAAEQTRVAMSRKWLGSDGEPWQPKCEIFLHPTGGDYSRVTGVPPASPGHSRIESDPSNGRVVGRRIDLHCDVPGLLTAVLPHETTHVVLAGQFGSSPVPRWVDEGVAVLTEPAEKIAVHRQNLARFQREQGLFSARELMQMNEYPQPQRIGAFYAESVALVDFLSRQRDPQTFCRFVRDGLREGYEPALRRHYGYRDFAELEQRWGQQVLAPLNSPASAVAGR